MIHLMNQKRTSTPPPPLNVIIDLSGHHVESLNYVLMISKQSVVEMILVSIGIIMK